jgi:hypothetical protein
MKNRLIVAFLAFGVAAAACGDNPPPPRRDASVDAPAIDASVPADALDAAADVMPDPDAGTADARTADIGAADRAEAATSDGPAVEGGGGETIDTGPDTGGDVGSDGRSPDTDAGVTCGPGVSREMLCITYCDGMGRFCTRANAQYGGDEECRAACNAPTWACGNPGETTGDSLFCRVAHMALAGVGVAATECPNAGRNSPTCR